MTSQHQIFNSNASQMNQVPSASVALVVTSPPYPMVSMWDQLFSFVESSNPDIAYTAMHDMMQSIWQECYRLLQPGGFLCINIGDATRSLAEEFRLFTNHSRITSQCESLGFTSLPAIIWRKQSNAPNKFMGSGMLPAGAYVTLEHEYILIFRKGGKRHFNTEEQIRRRQSAYFWEERNTWFSDLWEIKGARQTLNNTQMRERSAAYPIEIPWRLINMYSCLGDTILDPFMGTGTSMHAALALGRHSIGYELDSGLAASILNLDQSHIDTLNQRVSDRLLKHRTFMAEYSERKGPAKYHNHLLGCPVITNQEKELCLWQIARVEQTPTSLKAYHQALAV